MLTQTQDEAPSPVPEPHTDAYMGMEARRQLWNGFGRGAAWFLLHLLMIIAYMVFVLAAGADWLGSLIVIAALGLIAGALMRLGAGWTAFVAAFAAGVIIIRGVVSLASAVLG